MKNLNSYEDVMRELELVSEELGCKKELDLSSVEDYNGDFKFEYAHESLTERHSAYKRRGSHV